MKSGSLLKFKYPLIGSLILTLGIALIPTQALADDEVRYVSDVMYIPLRRGPGNQQEIIVNNHAS
jgi:hypothetical protein